MLELTRWVTPARTSMTRVAGCYIDRDGEFDGSFNTNFLKLSGSDRAKNLGIYIHLSGRRALKESKARIRYKKYCSHLQEMKMLSG